MSKWIASPLRQRLSRFAFRRAKHIVSIQLDGYIWFHADSELKDSHYIFLVEHPSVESELFLSEPEPFEHYLCQVKINPVLEVKNERRDLFLEMPVILSTFQ